MIGDDKDFQGFIRRSTEDKLTYKNIISDAINWCRRMMGTMYFKASVEGLERIIKFDVPGYKLKSELLEIKNQLEKEKQKRVDDRRKKMGRRFFGNAVQAKFKIEQREWYWNAYFERIIQLLADNNLLIDTEKRIPVKMIDELKDKDEE